MRASVRRRTRWLRRPAVVCATLVALAATASCAIRTQVADLPGCVVLDHLSVRTLGEVSGPLGRRPALGSSATYVRRLYDHGGAPLATVYGKSHVRLRMGDGHLLESTDEILDFDDGTVQAQGLHDLTALSAGKADYIATIGTSGVFRDKLGRLTLRSTGRSATTYSAELKMCPAGILK